MCKRSGIGIRVVLQLRHRLVYGFLEAVLALGELLMTRETVATDTPDRRATSFIVAIGIPERSNAW